MPGRDFLQREHHQIVRGEGIHAVRRTFQTQFLALVVDERQRVAAKSLPRNGAAMKITSPGTPEELLGFP